MLPSSNDASRLPPSHPGRRYGRAPRGDPLLPGAAVAHGQYNATSHGHGRSASEWPRSRSSASWTWRRKRPALSVRRRGLAGACRLSASVTRSVRCECRSPPIGVAGDLALGARSLARQRIDARLAADSPDFNPFALACRARRTAPRCARRAARSRRSNGPGSGDARRPSIADPSRRVPQLTLGLRHGHDAYDPARHGSGSSTTSTRAWGQPERSRSHRFSWGIPQMNRCRRGLSIRSGVPARS